MTNVIDRLAITDVDIDVDRTENQHLHNRKPVFYFDLSQFISINFRLFCSLCGFRIITINHVLADFQRFDTAAVHLRDSHVVTVVGR